MIFVLLGSICICCSTRIYIYTRIYIQFSLLCRRGSGRRARRRRPSSSSPAPTASLHRCDTTRNPTVGLGLGSYEIAQGGLFLVKRLPPPQVDLSPSLQEEARLEELLYTQHTEGRICTRRVVWGPGQTLLQVYLARIGVD